MPKMSTERRHLQGQTMGTQWSVLIEGAAPPEVQAALQAAVDRVNTEMSTWSPHSDLMQFNAAPLGEWIALPAGLITVLGVGLTISRATAGAFEMNTGAAVRAWGFCADPISLDAIRSASQGPIIPATTALEVDPQRGAARKTAPLMLDLSGIAKGYGVDQLAAVLIGFGISQALCAIDGELRALGTQADGTPWPVAVDLPDADDRRIHSILSLSQGAVATSGDYRHFVMVKENRLSHTIDPRRNAPVVQAPASVSVLAASCMEADAMATALMVMGADAGLDFAKASGISALFLARAGDGFRATGSGVFAG
ncbi:MAG: FAD:protein FMN transferase [Cypionkella sp.]